MERRINAPDKDSLTLEEVAAWLTLPVGTVKQLIRDRKFPPPVKVAPRQSRWQWMDVVAYFHLSARIPGFAGVAPKKKPAG